MTNIRPLEQKDIEKCLEIYNYYIENTTITFEETPLTLSDFSERINGITKRYPFLVAEEGGTVVGYAYFDIFNSRSAYRHTADLSVYLDNACLSKGIGSILYNELEKLAPKYEINNVISIITAENKKSVVFHEKNGFSFKGKLDNVGIKFERQLSVFFYQKTLCNL